MDAPTSEVGYTSATTRRGDHEVYVDMWWHWNKVLLNCIDEHCIRSIEFTVLTVMIHLSQNKKNVI
jgi:hypothetical protein